MISHALGIERIAVYTDFERPLTAAELDICREPVARRGRREPLAYINGHRGFRRLDLSVGPGVLVPRPETEILVEWAIAVAPPGARVLDWGTGSGAIALALADERPDLIVTGVDRSEEALVVARGNDAGHGVSWLLSDGFSALGGERFDVIAANPPYLTDAELAAAPAELHHEPAGALSSGPTGLEAITQIVADAPSHLSPGGWLVIEVGAAQAARVAELLGLGGYVDVDVRMDYARIPRVVGGRVP